MVVFSRRRSPWALVAALAGFIGLGSPASVQADAATTDARAGRRSGFEDMSPSVQALQRDAGLNPAWLWVDRGRELWARTACTSCHGPVASMAGVAARYPRWDGANGRPVSLEQQIRTCSSRSAAAPAPTVDDVLALTVAVVAASDGMPIQAQASTAGSGPGDGMGHWRRRGGELWRLRMGQLGLSCAQCHDERAGLRLGGVKIPQGHDTGYPLYRMEWQGVGSLERRIRGCMTGVRAQPFEPGSDDLLALEVFIRHRAAGMAVEAAAVRP